MPTYDYRCLNCGWEGEAHQKITDEPLEFLRHVKKGKSLIVPAGRGTTVCSGQMKRLISKTSFVLSGGGWSASGYTKEEEKP